MNVIIAIDKQDKVLTNIASNLVELLDKELLNPSLDIVPLTRDVNLFMSNRLDNMKVDFILRLRTSYVTSNRSTYQKIVSSNTQGPFGFRLLHTSHSLLEKEGWGQYGFNPCTEFKGLPGWIDFMDIELANMGDPKDIAAIGDGKVFAQSAAQWMNKAANWLRIGRKKK